MELHDSPQYLQINPDTSVSFDYTPKRYLTSLISLTNISSNLVAFKIRTNVPFSYLVKPAMGFIRPSQSIHITVTMQPTDYTPNTTSLNDKFLINAYSLEGESSKTVLNNMAVLKEIFKVTPQDLVQTHKLKVHLNFDSMENQNEDSLDTKDASGNESSPIRETIISQTSLEERGSLRDKLPELFARQMSERGLDDSTVSNFLETSVCSSQTSINLPRFHSCAEIQLGGLQEKISILQRQGSCMSEENAMISKRMEQKQTSEAEDYKRLYSQILEERNKLKEHLEIIKRTSFEKHEAEKKEISKEKGHYHLWHMLLVAVIALAIGALLKIC